MYKKRKCILLPTDKAEDCFIRNYERYLNFTPGYFTRAYLDNVGAKAFHLYIVSPEEIGIGDIVICYEDENFTDLVGLSRVEEHNEKYPKNVAWCHDKSISDLNYQFFCLKIIASTNKSLSLPGIPRAFLEQYARSYSKGEKMEEVTVEYEEVMQFTHNPEFYGTFTFLGPQGRLPDILKLKVNSDNTLFLKPIKDSWTRKEVIELLKKYDSERTIPWHKDDVDRWVNFNL